MRGGPRGFRPGFSCPAVLRNLQGRPCVFAYGTITLCGANFHSLRLTHDFVTSRPAGRRIKQALQPSRNNGCRLSRYGSLGSSLFARHYSGSRGFFPFLELLRCFSSLAYRYLPYFIQARARAHYHAYVSPFGHPGIKGWSAPPPGLSQPPTSFIGSWRQGIHRVLLVS